MPTIKCKNCGKLAYKKPFHIKKGQGVYCSRMCHYQDVRRGRNLQCFVCGKDIYRDKTKLNRSKSQKFFCSKSCQTIWRNQEFSGKNHKNFKTGRYMYRSILDRNKIVKICRLCGEVDKRIIAIHHVDQNRNNNILSNLTWLCHNCHYLVHRDKVEKQKLRNILRARVL